MGGRGTPGGKGQADDRAENRNRASHDFPLLLNIQALSCGAMPVPTGQFSRFDHDQVTRPVALFTAPTRAISPAA